METTETYYEIQVKGETVNLRASSNDGGDFCVSTEYLLDVNGNIPLRFADENSIKKFLRKGSTEWYNASMDTPNWNYYTAEDFTFVKVIVQKTVEPIVVTLEEEVRLEDIFKTNYTKSDLRPKMRSTYGNDAHIITVWRDTKTLKFDVELSDVANLLKDKVLSLGGYRLFTFVDVVKQSDDDYYYVVMNEITD